MDSDGWVQRIGGRLVPSNIHRVQNQRRHRGLVQFDPGYAYTLQYRDYALGAWKPVINHYGWPTADSRWTEPSISVRSPRFYRVVAKAIVPVQRGKLMGAMLLGNMTVADVQGSWRTLDMELLQVGVTNKATAQWPIRLYKIIYQTVQPSGLPVQASGTLFLPIGSTNALPLVSYQHGTTEQRTAVPSQNWQDYYGTDSLAGVILATAGYATLMPDYIGLGNSPGSQAYCHAVTVADTVIDLLRATRTFCATNGVTLSSQLFLCGFSEGGHATLATQREIERGYTNEFTVTAAAPIGAATDISGVYLDYLLSVSQGPASSVAMLVFAYTRIYDLADTFEELVAPAYRATIPPLFDGSHSDSEVDGIVPAKPYAFLRPDVLAAFRADPNHPLRSALRDNDVYDWTPQAPVHLYHSHGDQAVPYSNSQKAYDTFLARGACCVAISDPSASVSLNHGPSQYPSLLGAKQWFDSMKH